MAEILGNLAARRLFLHGHALAEPPVGAAKGVDLAALIGRLGYVQIDSINTVERAHHMILFARRQSYRPDDLKPLVEQDRLLFEHWTHDASLVPIGAYGHWHHRFARSATRLDSKWESWFRVGYREKFAEILARITAEGAVSCSDVGEGEDRGRGGWWDWHPSKTALEWLWRTGALAISRRDGFQKVYDLSERVIPEAHRAASSEAAMLDWACTGALERLGFATSGEMAAFYDAVTPEEAKAWCAAGLQRGDLVEIAVEGADGARRRCFARPDVLGAAALAPEPPGRIRILSPFDPALRDRNRTERLFGFRYRIEVFVPEAKRQYGYYVFPVLEGSQIIGRIDMKARRADGVLQVRAFWPEPGIVMGPGRLQRLEAELARMARFAGCERVGKAPDWLKQAG